MKALVILFALASFSFQAASSEKSAGTTISFIQSYPEYGEGDVIFRLKTVATTCEGYWLSPADPGFSQNLSLTLSAFHSGSTINAYGLTDSTNKWPGSGTHFCKLYSIKLTK